MKFSSKKYLAIYRSIRELAPPDRNTAPPSLKELVLNVSEGCNLTCSYCFAARGRYGSQTDAWMSLDIVEKSLRHYLDNYSSIEKIKLFGGEPFMNIKAIESAVRIVFKHSQNTGKKISIGAVTNGTIYSHRISELCKKGFTFTISIDGPIQIHDHYRRYLNGRGSFNKIVDVIARYHSDGVSPTSIDTVFTPDHLHLGHSFTSIQEYIRREFSINTVNITPAYFENLYYSESEFAAAIRKLSFEYAFDEVKKFPLTSPSIHMLMKQLTRATTSSGWCSLGDSTQTVMANGDILPCYTLGNARSEWKLATLAEAHTKTPNVKQLVNRLHELNPRRLPLCENCDIKDICWGCPGGTFSTAGILTDITPMRCAFRIGLIEGILEGLIQRKQRD